MYATLERDRKFKSTIQKFWYFEEIVWNKLNEKLNENCIDSYDNILWNQFRYFTSMFSVKREERKDICAWYLECKFINLLKFQFKRLIKSYNWCSRNIVILQQMDCKGRVCAFSFWRFIVFQYYLSKWDSKIYFHLFGENTTTTCLCWTFHHLASACSLSFSVVFLWQTLCKFSTHQWHFIKLSIGLNHHYVTILFQNSHISKTFEKNCIIAGNRPIVDLHKRVTL